MMMNQVEKEPVMLYSMVSMQFTVIGKLHYLLFCHYRNLKLLFPCWQNFQWEMRQIELTFLKPDVGDA